MSSRKSREIECLERLSVMAVPLDDILTFLLDEKVISREQIKSIKGTSDHAKQIQAMLAGLRHDEKVQLVEYEWQLLPVERIKVTIVTDRNNKEFTYDST